MPAVLRVDDRKAADGRRSAALVDAGQVVHEWSMENLRGPLPVAAGAGPFVVAAVLPAMARGTDVHVEGAVDRRLLVNLLDFQEFWRCWRPDLYRGVTITADEVTDPAEARDGRVMGAFSGGVDGAFTAYRHLHHRQDLRPRLDAVLLVQGADIDADDAGTFARVLARVETLFAEEDGVEVLAVRTNFRRVFPDWEHGHGAAIASCMMLFAPDFSAGLLGSTEDVGNLVLPWGSSPVTDHLLSSSRFRVRNDGAGFSRTEKVAQLARWSRAADNLRVCWQGDALDRNCGQCEKCQRTWMNFRAVGVEEPRCMPEDVGRARVVLRNNVALAEWRSIAAYAAAEGRSQVAAEARSVIRRSAPRRWAKRALGR